jgi:hypothetical protein
MVSGTQKLFLLRRKFEMQKSKSKSCCDRLSVSMSWCQVHSGTCDQLLLSDWKLLCCLCGAPLSDEKPGLYPVSHCQQYLVHCQNLIQFTFYMSHMFHVSEMYSRPLSAQAQYRRLYPIICTSNLRYMRNAGFKKAFISIQYYSWGREGLLMAEPSAGKASTTFFKHAQCFIGPLRHQVLLLLNYCFVPWWVYAFVSRWIILDAPHLKNIGWSLVKCGPLNMVHPLTRTRQWFDSNFFNIFVVLEFTNSVLEAKILPIDFGPSCGITEDLHFAET